MASRSTKGMLTKAMQKGLDGAVAGADLDACAGEVDFNKDVGKSNTRQAELAKLSRTNACANGSISFLNGQTWNVPACAKPHHHSDSTTQPHHHYHTSHTTTFHTARAIDACFRGTGSCQVLSRVDGLAQY